MTPQQIANALCIILDKKILSKEDEKIVETAAVRLVSLQAQLKAVKA